MIDSVFVVGCGSIGQRHIRNLCTLDVGEIVAFDPDVGRQAQAGELGAVVAPTLEAGLAQSPQAVLVCTPPHLHTLQARQALEAGAHLFVEKPMAHALDGLDELIAAAQQRRRVLYVGYNLRFHAGLRKLKELLHGGAIGKLLMIRAEVGQYLPDWRPAQDYRAGYNVSAAMGGGILLDASHELDYVCWLGGEVERMYCAAGHLSQLEMDTEDAAAITLRMSSGVIAEVHLDSIQRGYARNCKLIGEEGTLVWDFRTGVRWLTGDTKEWREFPLAPDVNEMYVEEMRHFLHCVRGEAEPLVDGETGKRVLEIALAAKLSAQTRREMNI